MTRLDPLDQPICLEVPERLTPGSAWHEHIPFAMYLVAALRPRILVELGTHYGDSFCAFCQAVKTLGLDTGCYAIDTWAGDVQSGFYGPEVLDDLRRHHDPRYGSFSRLIQSTFDEALGYFPDRSVDLLHIDGFHAYEAVRHDVETWLPKTSARAVVLLHDINVREREFGVWRLWQELAPRYPHFAFMHGHGLGVLAMGAEPPEPLRPLFDAADDEIPRVRRVFFELGHRLSLRLQRDQLHAERDRLHGERDQLQGERDRLQGERDRLQGERDRLQGERDKSHAERDQLRAERDQRVRLAAWLQLRVNGLQADSEAQSLRLRGEIERLQGELRALDHSLVEATWMKAHPLWRAYMGARLRLVPHGSRRERLWYLTRGALGRLRSEGPIPVGDVRAGRPEADTVGEVLDLNRQYERWLERHRVTPDRIAGLRVESRKLAYRPTISIVTPVYDVAETWLREAIESVREQAYEQWELWLVDDASPALHIRPLLTRYAALDPRIRVTFLPENRGIASATNEGLRLATGEFVGFLDHDDVLYPDALLEVARRLEREPDLDAIYSDEDKIESDGRRHSPFFKPDWSPDLILSVNYTCHFSVYRRTLLEELEGLRAGFEGSQDLDLILRVGERTERIAHIPRVLYGWRQVVGSAAASVDAKPHAYVAAEFALREALDRRRLEGSAEIIAPGRYCVRYPVRGTPRVSIIVPMRDRADLTRRCVASIEARSSYKNVELLILDNGSVEVASRRYLEEAALRHRVIPYDRPFNYSAINNFGAVHASGEYLLFLNNDTEVESPDWVEAMLEHAQRRDVGAVGAKLLYPDRRIQHAGVIILGTEQAFAVHAFKHLSEGTDAYFGLAQVVRNVSAVTGACLMIRRQVFEEMRGFDEALRVAYGDVDLCLRLRQAGYLIVYTPLAALVHHESATRKALHPLEDEQLVRKRWREIIARGDPYYNPNLSHTREDFSLDV